MDTRAGRAELGIGELAILSAAAAYGVSTTVSVAALGIVEPADLVAVELCGGALLLFAIGLLRGQIRLDGAGRNALMGVLMPGIAFVLGDLGLSRTSASAGSLLLAADTPISVVLSIVILREALRGRAIVALVIGLVGSVVIALGNGGDGSRPTTSGNLLVLASLAAAGMFLVLARRYNVDDGWNATAWQTCGAAVGTTPFVAFGWWHGGTNLPTAGWEGWSLAVGVLAVTALGGVAFNWGISRVPGVRASQLFSLTPVVGLVSAVVFLGERPTGWQLVGGALVLLAVVVLVRAAEGIAADAVPGGEPAYVAELVGPAGAPDADPAH